MAKFRISHEDDNGNVVRSRAATVTDVAACYATFRDNYGQIMDAKTGEMRDRTDDEVFQAWTTGFMLGTVANVNAYLDRKARAEVVPPTIAAIPE
jgi:hypothetical protein